VNFNQLSNYDPIQTNNYNDNNFSTTMFKNDDHEHGERSLERDSNIISSNGKTFKSSNKVYHLEKHKNLLKIINMYMKDYKKNHSKMKIAALLKNKNKIKKSNIH